MHPEVLDRGGCLHSCSIYVEGGVSGDRPTEVYNHLLGLLDVQVKVVVPTPPCQVLHLPPILRFVSLGDESYHCCVICKLHHQVIFCSELCNQMSSV